MLRPKRKKMYLIYKKITYTFLFVHCPMVSTAKAKNSKNLRVPSKNKEKCASVMQVIFRFFSLVVCFLKISKLFELTKVADFHEFRFLFVETWGGIQKI